MDAVKKVLYIGGNTQQSGDIEHSLLNEKYDLSTASNGRSALKQMETAPPDVVIVEYSLDDMTAVDLFTQVQSDDCFKEKSAPPFIALTQNGEADKSILYGLGFSACLKIPVQVSELPDFIEDVLVSHQLRIQENQFWDAVRKAKDFLESVVESSVDAILTTDQRGIVTYCNLSCEEMTGYSFDEMVGKRVDQYLKGGASEILKLYSMLNKRGKVTNHKTEVKKKDGTAVPINLSLNTMKDSDGQVMGVLSISKPITGKEFSEYDNHESERLTTIIETAVAVNHAINNPLVPILGNAQFLLQDDSIVDEDAKKRLRAIVKNALRIRDITQKLARITNPVTKEYLRGTRMLDIDAST